MALTFEIAKVDHEETPWADVYLVDCEVRDDDHPKVRAFFRFVVSDPGDGTPSRLFPAEMRLVPPPHRYSSRFSPGLLELSAVRDLPLVRWERAAGAAVAVKYNGLSVNFIGMPASLVPQEHRDRLAADMALGLYPELNDAKTPAERRRRDSLMKLAQAAVDYRALLADGRDDPAAEIARRHDITPATARSWIYRARKAGFLGRAKDRTAGEEPVTAAELERDGVIASISEEEAAQRRGRKRRATDEH